MLNYLPAKDLVEKYAELPRDQATVLMGSDGKPQNIVVPYAEYSTEVMREILDKLRGQITKEKTRMEYDDDDEKEMTIEEQMKFLEDVEITDEDVRILEERENDRTYTFEEFDAIMKARYGSTVHGR